MRFIRKLLQALIYYPDPPPPLRPTRKERVAKVISILENTYGQDCGDVENIDKAIDILNGGAY